VTDAEQPSHEHTHDAVTHAHEHYHVTHNFFEHSGVFEHLGFNHHHEHAHLTDHHVHFPHQNYESEHASEAHEHPHPIAGAARTGAAKRPAARRAAAVAPAPETVKASPGAGGRGKKPSVSGKTPPTSRGGEA
jgi:hypothetical protein